MTQQPERVPLFGLDLGKRADPSALVGGYRETLPDGRHSYHWRFIYQWRLDTPYREVRADLRRFILDASIDRDAVSLALDMTGPGESVTEEVIADLPVPVHCIWITGGNKWRRDEVHGSYNVAKGILVSTVGALFSSNRITFAKGMREAPMLLKELDEFKVKISKSENELYEAREGVHDDLVLAVAIACWVGENVFIGGWEPPTGNRAARTFTADAPPGVFLSDDRGEGPREIGADGCFLPRED